MQKSETPTPTPYQASWSQLLYLVLFFIIGRFVSLLVLFASLFQFIYIWINDKPNENLLGFTQTLSSFAKEVIDYLTFNRKERPWPFGTYPKG